MTRGFGKIIFIQKCYVTIVLFIASLIANMSTQHFST